MKIKLLAIITVFVFSSTAFSQSGAEYIGYEFPSVLPGTVLPNGVKELGGALIGDINADPVYGIAQVQKGKTKMLWLEVSTGQDAKGVKGWKVLDVLTFASLARTRYIFFTGDPSIGCKRKGEVVANLVGDGRIDRARGRFVPSNLWVANIETKKFERIPVGGIMCEYSEP
jgi:hypothetical protein